MAKLWAIQTSGSTRYFVTEKEARLIMAGGELGEGAANLGAVELDELELRQAAANWLNMQAKCRENALRREANKTAKQRSDNMRKAWATRKKNLQ